MAEYDPLDASNDPFGPPAIPTLVACLHCGEEYESYRIEWRVQPDVAGEPHGFWCCPIPGCGGKGFGFDILPVDPEYQDENGGWIHDDDTADEEEDWLPDEAEETRLDADAKDQRPNDDDALPW